MGLRLETLGSLTVLFSSVIALFLLPSLSPGLVGLVITTSLSLSGQLHWLVRQWTELAVQLNAVERVLEFAQLQPEEDDERWELGWLADSGAARHQQAEAEQQPLDTDPSSSAVLIPPADWPAHGRIEFHHLSVAYRPPPDDVTVLHDVCAVVEAGEKVGIVGRTGAGKSSLSLALFRLMEAQRGFISIDGLPCHRIPLHLLRSRLMIIPQESVLFAHSLRYVSSAHSPCCLSRGRAGAADADGLSCCCSALPDQNLDPFDAHSDSQLWDALRRVGLREFVQRLPLGLLHPVQDGGENLSMGQRQLLCLCRALLRPSKILVMDEASAALDLACDGVMRSVVASAFASCTQLTIAHRLATVLDSDRIMLFEAGRLAEFDSPQRLMSRRGGLLAQLMRDAQAMTRDLRQHGTEGAKAGGAEGEEKEEEKSAARSLIQAME